MEARNSPLEIFASGKCCRNRDSRSGLGMADNLKKKLYLCSDLIQNDMNLRDIKKDIQYVIGAFVDDCTLFLNVNPGKNADAIADLIDQAVDLYNDLRDQIVSAPKEGVKAYYAGISKQLLEKTDALYDELSAAVKKGLGE